MCETGFNTKPRMVRDAFTARAPEEDSQINEEF